MKYKFVSKEQAKSDWENGRVQIEHLGKRRSKKLVQLFGLDMTGDADYYIKNTITTYICGSKFPNIPSVPTDELWEMIFGEYQEEEKQWELVDMKHGDGTIHPYHKVSCTMSNPSCTIHSVKRSDGVVFTVDDEVKIVSNSVLGWDRNPYHKIKSFYIDDSTDLWVICRSDIPVCGNNLTSDAYKSGHFKLNQIQKLQSPQPQEEIIGYELNGKASKEQMRDFLRCSAFDFPLTVGEPHSDKVIKKASELGILSTCFNPIYKQKEVLIELSNKYIAVVGKGNNVYIRNCDLILSITDIQNILDAHKTL